MAPSKENQEPNTAVDVLYVPQAAFEVVKAKLSVGDVITNEEVDQLVNPLLKGNEKCIPLDMNGAGENLDDFEAALAKLGAKCAAECLVKAQEHLEKVQANLPKRDRLKPVTAKQYKKMYGDEFVEDDDEPSYNPDLFHVPKILFAEVRAKLAKNLSVAEGEVRGLVQWEPQDETVYVPTDLRGCDEDLDEFEEVLANLGPQKTAASLVQAFEYFERKKSCLPEEMQEELTGKEWQLRHGNDEDEQDEDQDDAHAEEEEDDDDDSDAEEDGDDDDDEPAAKKAKHC